MVLKFLIVLPLRDRLTENWIGWRYATLQIATILVSLRNYKPEKP